MTSLKVLFLAAEAEPFIKVGGLGDVAGALPQALRALSLGDQLSNEGIFVPQVDIRLAIPLHEAISRQEFSLKPVASFNVPHARGPIPAAAFETEVNGLPVYLIAGPPIMQDAAVYSTDASMDGYKYTFFSLAALELARKLGWAPDIVHANDWHTAPAIYALSLNRDSHYINVATLLGLHNLPYLGVGAGPVLGDYGLPPAIGNVLPTWARHMPLPLGLLTADHIVAVSPNYAREILTPEFGSGLEEFLKRRVDSISGILNGINLERWNPETDSALETRYSRENLPARQANKAVLIREFGLNPDPAIPLLAMVTRLDPQKGVDLIPAALRQISSHPWQIILLGTGVPKLEAAVRQLEAAYPGRVRAAIRFDAALSHRIYAGADALLIPSRYEPCGLTQMIAMRYGCVPVARATGGLRDTIQDLDATPESTGFLFEAATAQDLGMAITRTLKAYTNPQIWKGLQLRGMAQDFSWERFARQYLELYLELVKNHRKN